MNGPTVRFLIGGVQKGGTSALARYLQSHPDIRLPAGKEAHVFDDPRASNWTAVRFEAEYEGHFPNMQGSRPGICGDATPIYCFHPALIERIARYNPAMRWIILLRDPIERAISHYYMERNRGQESLSLAAALLAEPWRLRGKQDDFSADSSLRRHSYCARGRYARQLDALYGHFPQDQVLILRSMDLLAHPANSMDRVHAFLGVAPQTGDRQFERVFQGSYAGQGRHPWVRWVLRQRFRRELSLLRSRHGVSFDSNFKHTSTVA
ncbi:sulfotransferase [Thermomonas sp.]|uniref:sulfotransferase family protein n=1 Tax=Thermomonas sp. TaxID=1971895 RepID=UPI00248858A4|nr:sulfotransferase [Thermomonas sp.]MDI1254186.1 sulfotransferase [Thermomonas sp.]